MQYYCTGHVNIFSEINLVEHSVDNQLGVVNVK